MSCSFRWTGFLAVSFLLLSITSCGTRTVRRSTVSTTIGARTVKASVDGGAFIATQDDTALVSFGSHKVAVEPDRLLLDGKEEVRFAADATNVHIAVSDGEITATIDGKQVLAKAVD
jgi:hypothetical protein